MTRTFLSLALTTDTQMPTPLADKLRQLVQAAADTLGAEVDAVLAAYVGDEFAAKGDDDSRRVIIITEPPPV